MIREMSLPKYFWVDVINNACHVLNRVVIRPILERQPMSYSKAGNLTFPIFHVFSCKCFILNKRKENLGKFNAKSDEGIFLGYSSSSKAYRVYNHGTYSVEESIHVSFDESFPQKTRKGICLDISSVITENLI